MTREEELKKELAKDEINNLHDVLGIGDICGCECPECHIEIDLSEAVKRVRLNAELKGIQETNSKWKEAVQNELRGLYFLVKKGHDERIQAQIDILERIFNELTNQSHELATQKVENEVRPQTDIVRGCTQSKKNGDTK